MNAKRFVSLYDRQTGKELDHMDTAAMMTTGTFNKEHIRIEVDKGIDTSPEIKPVPASYFSNFSKLGNNGEPPQPEDCDTSLE